MRAVVVHQLDSYFVRALEINKETTNFMNYLLSEFRFSNLSISDLLKARDQFHVHLMNKPNVVGTAVGRYLIRKDDPWPDADTAAKDTKQPKEAVAKIPRTLENSEVREYSWP